MSNASGPFWLPFTNGHSQMTAPGHTALCVCSLPSCVLREACTHSCMPVQGIVAGVPFVDCLTTMLDDSIPLTVGALLIPPHLRIANSTQHSGLSNRFAALHRLDHPVFCVAYTVCLQCIAKACSGCSAAPCQVFIGTAWTAAASTSLLLMQGNMMSGAIPMTRRA